MSIITDQTFTSDGIQHQMNAAQNCIGIGLTGQPYCPSYYPTPIVYNQKRLSIELVEGGYIVSCYLRNKGDIRTVAVNDEGLALILKSWRSQFENA